MAVVERISTVRHTNNVDSNVNWRQFQAVATVLDTAAGSSVAVTYTQSNGGGALIGAPPTSAVLIFRDDAGTTIRTVTLRITDGTDNITFHFTNDGTSTGTARCGTVEMLLDIEKAGGVDAWSVESDGSPNTPQTGFTFTILDRGWIRGTTTLVEDISNTSLGGAPSAPAAYDESLFVRLTSGAASYVARALTVSLTHGSLSGSTNSTTSATRDVTFTNVVDERFPAASTSVGLSSTIPNATLTGQADWTHTSTTDDTLNVDPRLTCTHHFQIDDDVFGLAKDDTTKQMLSTQSGFLWTIVKNARAAGVNGLTVTQTLDPTNPGTTITGSGSTSTQDSQVGVSARLDWTAAKPGGTWAKTVDVTAPADIDADTHLLSSTDTLTMLNTDPRISVLVRVGASTTAADDRHVAAGDNIKVSVSVFNRVTRARLTPDAAPSIALVRYNVANARWEYLDSADETSWVAWASDTADSFTLTQESGTDTFSWARTFTTTSGWSSSDIVAVQVAFNFGGTPYGFYVGRELVAAANPHDSYSLDPLAAAAGVLSFR